MADFYIIDGNSYIHRAYHAIPPLTTSKGEMVNAVYGFIKMLLNIVKTRKPDYLSVCFDHPSPTFRHKEFDFYKAHRKEIDDELKNQMPLAREAVKALNMISVELGGYEADDLIATLASQASGDGANVFIVTSDKDALQMVGGNIKVWNEGKNTVYDREAVKERYGLYPDQLIDMFALMGDASDNVPGIKGIGEKTAVKLMQKYGTLEGIFENAKEIEGKTGALIQGGKSAAESSKRLVTLVTNVALDIKWSDCKLKPYDEAALTDFLRRMEFKSLLNEMLPEKKLTDQTLRFEPETAVILTSDDLESLIETAKSKKMISIDTETTGINPLAADLVGISAAFDEKKAYYIPVGHSYLGMPRQLDKDKVMSMLRPVLENSEIRKYGQNIKYDLLMLKRSGAELKGVYFDSMIASYCLNPSKNSHGLKSMMLADFGMRMTEIEDLIGKGAKQTTMDKIEIEKAAPYAGADAAAVMLVSKIFEGELKQRGLEKLFYDIEMPLVGILAGMEHNGIKADTGYVRELIKKFEEEISRLQAEIFELAGEEFNPNSTKQLAVILFEKLKLPFLRKTKTGYSTDEETLQTLSGQHELPAKILEYRELQKLKSTYLESMLELSDSGGRVHTSFNQAVTATGRLSSSEPNLQNIPIKSEYGRMIRKCFIAEKGYTLLSSDYSQIDLRSLAHITGDDVLKKAFQEGRDIHTATAMEVFGVQASGVTPELRRIAKTINFGIIYGMSAFSLSQQLSIPPQQAKEYIENYFKRYSGVKKWMDEIIEFAKANGFVKTVAGRIRYLPDINSKNGQIRGFSERMALNTPVQGTSADIIKIAMIDIDKHLKSSGSGARMLLQVHDELLFEVPDGEMREVPSKLKYLMENAMKLDVPTVVEVKAGANWNEMDKLKFPG